MVITSPVVKGPHPAWTLLPVFGIGHHHAADAGAVVARLTGAEVDGVGAGAVENHPAAAPGPALVADGNPVPLVFIAGAHKGRVIIAGIAPAIVVDRVTTGFGKSQQ